jgi:hypothetical protein
VGAVLDPNILIASGSPTRQCSCSPLTTGSYFGEHGFLGKSVWDADLGTPSWSPLCREIVEVLVRMSGASGVARRR